MSFLRMCFVFGLVTAVLGVAVAEEAGGMVWRDGSELRIDGKGWSDTPTPYSRLPERAEEKVRKPVWDRSLKSAGLVIHFNTDARKISFKWTLTSGSLAMHHMPATGVSGLDLYVKNADGKWLYVRNARPTGKSSTGSVNIWDAEKGNMREYKLYLPLYNGIESLQIGVPEGAKFEQPDVSDAKPIVYYGTSITQGACASRPGMAFAAMIERELGVPLINLGFSGNGRMEPEVAELLAELDPQVYVVDCLWNLTRAEDETIQERARNLIWKIRSKHAETPILFVGQSNFRGLRTGKTEALLEELEKAGDNRVENVHFLPGRDLLGDDGDGTVDGVHPNDLGMRRHADVLIPAIRELIAEEPEPKDAGEAKSD
ncbi:hypothetical protein STSP2_00790 [Anaerohalosphaera lusitana]|uniref:SGNH hydrolase-type esterase domain-containing protein n=1 Tax=Anaerohalosphaera lusitana TaxID=1936003 RepID=A0A1U9NI76_9BACT|nr:SGNH/GDSL hydrolase family protein [Anaerohalosphaera lusitana]AQT67642.1 hypothetical protein STSP2_00790 [Anaerohalosphaera lusitana]